MIGAPVYFPESGAEDLKEESTGPPEKVPRSWRFEHQDSSVVLSQLASAKSPAPAFSAERFHMVASSA